MITGITNVRDRDTFTKKIQIGECSQKGTRECSSKEMVARKEGTIQFENEEYLEEKEIILTLTIKHGPTVAGDKKKKLKKLISVIYLSS